MKLLDQPFPDVETTSLLDFINSYATTTELADPILCVLCQERPRDGFLLCLECISEPEAT